MKVRQMFWERVNLPEGPFMQGWPGDVPDEDEPFRVLNDEWDDEPEPSGHNPDGLPERVIREWERA